MYDHPPDTLGERGGTPEIHVHDTPQPPAPPPPPPPPARPDFRVHRALLPVSTLSALLGFLVLVLAVAGMNRGRQELPWTEALVAITDEAPWDGMHPAWVRSIAAQREDTSPLWQEFAAALESTEDGRMVLEVLAMDEQERVIAIDVPLDLLEPVLESGRLPEPGRPEALAGDLVRWERFIVDDVEFEVVGRVSRDVSAAVFGYIVPFDVNHAGLFTESPESQTAWFDPVGVARILEMDREELESTLPEDAKILGGLARAPGWVVAMNLLGIALMMSGGAGIHIGLFRRWAGVRIPILGSLFYATAQWPRLFAAHHIVFFGMFLSVMAVGAALPLANMRLMNFIQGIFQEGHLQYVGDAYASGNILRAAAATFVNNYVHQTLLLTLAASVVVPFFGLLKTAASFVLAGFGMAPIWTATIQVLPFHAVTIALELEAYVVACFAVTLWPVYLVLAVARRRAVLVVHGAAIMGSTAVVTAILLALAALYEAASLIILRF